MYHFSGEKKFKCVKCGRSYKQKVTLVRHQRYECGIVPQFPCSFCPYRAKHRAHLDYHIRYRHTHKPKPREDILRDMADQGLLNDKVPSAEKMYPLIESWL